MMKISWTLFFLLTACVGCHLGPTYELPEVEVPETWKTPSQCTSDSGPCLEFWWEVFQDDKLNELEQFAVANNPNLYAALDRVAEARAIAGVDYSALYPQLNAYPLFLDFGARFRAPSGIIPAGVPVKSAFRLHEQQCVLPFDLSYQIDLWGQLTGQYKSAVYNTEAQEENFRTVLLTLTTDLASSYFQLRALDAQIDFLESTIQIFRKNLALNQNRNNKGLSNIQDVLYAERELTDTEATYYETRRQRGIQEDAIAALLGIPASNFCLEHHPLKALPPCIPPGLPSEILLQRPDIRAAERTMASQQALIGVAYASFFPSLRLTGIGGFLSPDLKNFLDWRNRLWAFSTNIEQVLFDAGKNVSNLNYTYASFNEASHEYQQKVVTSFQEVEDALNNLEFQAKEYDSYRRSADAGLKIVQNSQNRFNRGIVNYFEVVTNEQSALSSQISATNLLGLQYVSTIQLIKALGGSWLNLNLSLQSASEEPSGKCESE